MATIQEKLEQWQSMVRDAAVSEDLAVAARELAAVEKSVRESVSPGTYVLPDGFVVVVTETTCDIHPITVDSEADGLIRRAVEDNISTTQK